MLFPCLVLFLLGDESGVEALELLLASPCSLNFKRAATNKTRK